MLTQGHFQVRQFLLEAYSGWSVSSEAFLEDAAQQISSSYSVLSSWMMAQVGDQAGKSRCHGANLGEAEECGQFRKVWAILEGRHLDSGTTIQLKHDLWERDACISPVHCHIEKEGNTTCVAGTVISPENNKNNNLIAFNNFFWDRARSHVSLDWTQIHYVGVGEGRVIQSVIVLVTRRTGVQIPSTMWKVRHGCVCYNLSSGIQG